MPSKGRHPSHFSLHKWGVLPGSYTCRQLTRGQPCHDNDWEGDTSPEDCTVRGELAGSSLSNYWVPDLLNDLAPSTTGGSVGVAESALELASLFLGDNVHLTPVGYAELAVSIVSSIDNAMKKLLESECVVTGFVRNFYWRGFTSRRGSARQKTTQSSLKMRGRGGVGWSQQGALCRRQWGWSGFRHQHRNPYAR